MGNKIVAFQLAYVSAIAVIVLGVILYTWRQLPSEKGENARGQRQTARIAVSPQSYDFGTVVYGDIASHTFTISNVGGAPLEILRLSTSCGCTSAEIAQGDRIIPPDENVSMIVRFDPAVHKDDSDIGAVTRVVYIRSNDANHPETEVVITAQVVKENTQSRFVPLSQSMGGIDVELSTLRQKDGNTVMELAFNNHRYNLGEMDVLGLSSWQGQRAIEYTVVSSASGGHHVRSQLVFSGRPSGTMTLGLRKDIEFTFEIP